MKTFIDFLPLLAALTFGSAHADTFNSGALYFETTSDTEVAVAPVPAGKAPYEGVVIIPEQVFYNGVNYTVSAIADSAFYQSQVTGVQVPNTVTAIGVSAFAYVETLANITLPLHLNSVSQTMLAGTTVTNVAVPEGVQTVGVGAFQSCAQLHTVLLPSTLSLIDAYGFNNCHNLYEMYCAAPTPPKASGWAIFIGLSNIDVIVPDEEAVTAYQANTVWGDSATFNFFPDEPISITMTNELDSYDAHYMRLNLGNNLAYKIYANDELIALTAADYYYVPITARSVTYTIVPTTMMSDADPVDVTVAPSAVENIEEDLAEPEPLIFARDGQLYIQGDNYGKMVRVFDMYGQLYYARPSTSGEVIELPRNRVYIVMVGNYVKKILL